MQCIVSGDSFNGDLTAGNHKKQEQASRQQMFKPRYVTIGQIVCYTPKAHLHYRFSRVFLYQYIFISAMDTSRIQKRATQTKSLNVGCRFFL